MDIHELGISIEGSLPSSLFASSSTLAGQGQEVKTAAAAAVATILLIDAKQYTYSAAPALLSYCSALHTACYAAVAAQICSCCAAATPLLCYQPCCCCCTLKLPMLLRTCCLCHCCQFLLRPTAIRLFWYIAAALSPAASALRFTLAALQLLLYDPASNLCNILLCCRCCGYCIHFLLMLHYTCCCPEYVTYFAVADTPVLCCDVLCCC